MKVNQIILVSLGCIATSASASFGQRVVTSAQVNGTWRERSGKAAGVTTEFWIWSLGGQKLKVEFVANNAARQFSNRVTDIALIEGTTATFTPADSQTDEKHPCTMTLKFNGGILIVIEKGQCGWGAGVGSAGTYKKVSSKKPKFDEH